MGSEPIAHEAEWAIDSEAMKARGIIVLVKSNQLVKNIETKKLQLKELCHEIQPNQEITNENAR